MNWYPFLLVERAPYSQFITLNNISNYEIAAKVGLIIFLAKYSFELIYLIGICVVGLVRRRYCILTLWLSIPLSVLLSIYGVVSFGVSSNSLI